MNDDARKKHLDESHDRAVRAAMAAASDDLIRRRQDRKHEENEGIESRLERIEQRLERLESLSR